jgi:hypothetical protein
MNRCDFCGRRYRLHVRDLYVDERVFTLSACCEGAEQDAIDWLADGVDRQQFRDWFYRETGLYVRGYAKPDGFYGVSVDFGLELVSIDQEEAKSFIRQHHLHASNPPCGWRWGHAVANGSEIVGVAMVGRPVARKLDHTRVVEVNRCCTNPFIQRELVWNACSMLYLAAQREAHKQGFDRIITYTRKGEAASALKAIGWRVEATSKGGSWNRPSRSRHDQHDTCVKIRWGKVLNRRAGQAHQLELFDCGRAAA